MQSTKPQETPRPKTGFMLERRESSRRPKEQAQLLLSRLEAAGEKIGLHLNHKKTEYMLYNQLDADLVTLEGKKLKRVDDFKYLGSWTESIKKDLETRIGLAWNALSKMEKMWNSNLHRSLKLHFFRGTVESVLLYGSES